MNYIGLKFLDFQYSQMEVISFMDQFNMYYVECLNDNGIKTNELMTSDDIDMYLNRQGEILQCKKDSEERKAQQIRNEEKEREVYNNTYGYCDHMEGMKKGRVLKVLNKEVKYNNEWITRKEFIHRLIKEGYTIRIVDKMMTSNKKIQGERIAKYRYNVPVIEKNGEFYIITKTEYDYAMYLIDYVA